MLTTEKYVYQCSVWPSTGRHILAQYDAESVVVYQAYRRSIGEWAIRHQKLGGPHFSDSRMSWIKPNFLWMMYRSGWGTKDGQQVTLALRLRREFFEQILGNAVQSSYYSVAFESREAWQQALARSEVRLQWDPDHGPKGNPLERRAIQLGLRGAHLRTLGNEGLLDVVDMTAFVESQRAKVQADRIDELDTPSERIYLPASPTTRKILGVET